MSRPPSEATIRRVVAYLENELDLELTGQCTQFDDKGWAYLYPSLGTFEIDDVLKLRKALRHNWIVDMTEQER